MCTSYSKMNSLKKGRKRAVLDKHPQKMKHVMRKIFMNPSPSKSKIISKLTFTLSKLMVGAFNSAQANIRLGENP